MPRVSAVFVGLSAVMIVGRGSALAQIIPDASLGIQSSQVDGVVDGIPIQVIDGGATRGGNLFHSFETFSVPSQTAVLFNNSPDIDRIISRVTGSQGSLIDGIVTANGAADLFLINPNGILFGPNARLLLGGSFVASTAEGLVFENGYQFGTVDPGIPPLLTVNVPIGLQMGSQPGDLGVLGSRLVLNTGETLALIGGDVDIASASILVESGHVELGSVAGEGRVGLEADTLQASYENAPSFGALNIRDNSFITVSGSPGGSVHMRGGHIHSQGSLVTSMTHSGEAPGGNIDVRASESIQSSDSRFSVIADEDASDRGGSLSLQAPTIVIDQSNFFVFTLGAGDSGDIFVEADQLSVLRGSQVSADALQGTGNAGSITIQAQDVLVDSIEDLPETLSGITSLAGFQSTGNSGSIHIQSNTLKLDNQGQISASTQGPGAAGDITLSVDTLVIHGGGSISSNTGGSGDAGQITIDATTAVEVSGTTPIFKDPIFGVELTLSSRISSESQIIEIVDITKGEFIGASGSGGTITLTTPELILKNEGNISTSTNGSGQGGAIKIQANHIQVLTDAEIESETNLEGKGGDISIQTDSLQITDSGGLSVITFGDGDAGNIEVQSNTIELLNGGQIQGSTASSGAGGQITVTAQDLLLIQGRDPRRGFPSGIAALVASGTGRGGDVQIVAPQVLILEDGIISVSSLSEESLASAGNLTVNSGLVILDKGSLNASSGTGAEGNVLVNADTLILRNQGSITTDASGTATGGNITIDSEVITLIENSQIVARAIEGQGGTIAILTEGFFVAPDSIISAASELGIDGVVDIITPNLDPAAGLVDPPDQVTDLGDLVATLCQQDQDTSSFVVIGRTGIPSSPSDLAQDPVIWQDLRVVGDPIAASPGEWYALRIPCAGG